MPPRLSRHYEKFYQAVIGLGDLTKKKKEFSELALLFRTEQDIEQPVKKVKSKVAAKPKEDEQEDGEVLSRKKVVIGVPKVKVSTKKKAKKSTASGKKKVAKK